MARSRKYTTAKRNRYLAEKRGQGLGSAYKPWHQVVGTHSKGRVARVKGVKIPRIYHFFNDLQRNFFYCFEWNLKIVDIREHYPLQRNQTLEISKSLNLRHPIDTQTKVYIDLTVEFFLTVKTEVGINKFMAFTVVNNKKRLSQQKLQIIQKYFEQRNVEWRILTREDLDDTTARNFAWCRVAFPETYLESLLYEYLLGLNALNTSGLNELNIVEAAIGVADAMKISIEVSMSVLKYLLAHKILKTSSMKVLFSHAKLKDFDFHIPLNQIQGKKNVS